MNEKFIPPDKSWLIRMAVLDIRHGRRLNAVRLLRSLPDLSGDLLALKRAVETWESGEPIDVGESGTLFRFLQFLSWKRKLGKKFVKQGTLKRRQITDDPSIVELSQPQLLTLDNGTSQWASAAVLAGDEERLRDPPHKLAVTYVAVRYWWRNRMSGFMWSPRRDNTIALQAKAFEIILLHGGCNYVPQQAEDYCFARACCGLTAEAGEEAWPSLRGHESDRIAEMEKAMAAARSGEVIDSCDHRVVQAMAMWGVLNKTQVSFARPEAVNKSWPQFWDFLKQYQ